MIGGSIGAQKRRSTTASATSMRDIGRKLVVGVIAPLLALVLAVPAMADTGGQDRQFLSALRSAGWTINSANVVTSQGHMVW